MKARYDAVLFDFDGVLVDSEPLHHECWTEVLARFGLGLTWEDYAANCIGVSDRNMIQALCNIHGRQDLFDPIWNLYPHKKQIFRERVKNRALMSEPTRALIAELAGGPIGPVALAVVSSSGRAEVEPPLEYAGVRDYFRVTVFGEDVKRLKPDPEPYLLAAEKLGVTKPLVVEDSEAGIASGRAAGFDVVQVPNAERTAELVRRAMET
ncbi:MAG TPA: HAD family phosphatase [Bryobacteraceae bacterium]|nr:HAD family phosphatase [Bryobacteraceae bacterium]